MDVATRRALATVAAAHAGAISVEQLRGLGVTESQLRTLCRQGQLTRVVAGVYTVAGSPPTVEQRLHVGLLSLGRDAVVSHEAAARLHRLDGSPPDAVEFTAARRARGRTVPFRVHTTGRWGPHDRVRILGFPCTSATRTIIDLAASGAAVSRVEAAVDAAIRLGLSSPVVLAGQLATRRGQPGVRIVRELLPDTGGHSWLERRFLELIRRWGLPRPDTQTVHRRGARTAARTDFCWRPQRLVVEVSGRHGHASDAERARDAQRRNELQELGWQVIEFTYRHVVDRPGYVEATMRRLLGDVSVSVTS